MIRMFAPGLPVPGGSKRAFVVKGKAVVTDTSGSRGREWRAVLRVAAQTAYRGLPLHGPLALTVTFFLPRPKSHYAKNGTLRPRAPRWPSTRPDATKLLRAVEDALNRVLWHDDAQIVTQSVGKQYADGGPGQPGGEIGAAIAVDALEDGASPSTPAPPGV
jgi:Holliday junction resolvase RusA-like endonuclease